MKFKSTPRWQALIAVAIVLALGAGYALWPRTADLGRFDPVGMARLETGMWRAYYDRRYADLFYGLYGVSRDQYNFSPFDSARIALAAARAARAFQPTTSRTEANAALPYLIDYFRVLAQAAPARFDVTEAARTELEWWQARREAVPPERYGLIIARVASLMYGVDGHDLQQSGVVRANAMAYRDARAETMTDTDWLVIAEQLRAAYTLLKQSLSVRTA